MIYSPLHEFNLGPKGVTTSVRYSMKPEPVMLTPSVKRMGLVASPNNENDKDSAESRMDLNENNDRLSAQVKAIQVLSTGVHL